MPGEWLSEYVKRINLMRADDNQVLSVRVGNRAFDKLAFDTNTATTGTMFQVELDDGSVINVELDECAP